MNKSRNRIKTTVKKVTAVGALTAMAATMTLTSVSGVMAADNHDVVIEWSEQDFGLVASEGIVLPDSTILQDGKYNVNVVLQQFSDPDSPSMAAGSLSNSAVLTVAGGKATIELTFQTLPLGPLFGNLEKLYYFNNKAECASGNTEYRNPSEILSYRDDAKGSDPETGNPILNLKMPEKVQFTLPYTDNKDIYIGIVVDIMKEMGMDFTEAVLRIDYNSAVEIVNKKDLITVVDNAKKMDTSLYTEISCKRLANAITAAQLILDQSDATQKQVNNALSTIEDAITKLEKIEHDQILDKDHLADGVYEMELDLWNAAADKASMAASAINGNMKLVVKDGVYTVHMYTKPMTFGTITASLQEMKVYKSADEYENADVVSRDMDGNPTEFTFILPSTSEFINVSVNPHVAMMGNQDIAARLKMEYGTLKYVSELPKDEEHNQNPVIDPEQNTDQDKEENVTVKDNPTDQLEKDEQVKADQTVNTADKSSATIPFTAMILSGIAVLFVAKKAKKKVINTKGE